MLESAVANADDRGANVDELVIESIYVNEGPRAKRMRPAPMGRSHRYVHRMAHIVVTVSDGRPDEIDEEEGLPNSTLGKGTEWGRKYILTGFGSVIPRLGVRTGTRSRATRTWFTKTSSSRSNCASVS